MQLDESFLHKYNLDIESYDVHTYIYKNDACIFNIEHLELANRYRLRIYIRPCHLDLEFNSEGETLNYIYNNFILIESIINNISTTISITLNNAQIELNLAR